jgi:hypothetical protein
MNPEPQNVAQSLAKNRAIDIFGWQATEHPKLGRLEGEDTEL